jgi:hypothetical protein
MKQVIIITGLLIGVVNASAQSSEIFVKNGAAIDGYDAVAYFTEGKPVKGSNDFSITWKSVKWLFVSKQNADLFRADPEKYAPQYGGYCAYGCSRGYKAKTSADAWTIANGKLYLNYDTGVRAIWSKDQQGYIQKADANWLKIKNDLSP